MAQMERDYDTPEGKEGADDDAYMMPMEQRDPMMWRRKDAWNVREALKEIDKCALCSFVKKSSRIGQLKSHFFCENLHS